jgi:hypothetical protein
MDPIIIFLLALVGVVIAMCLIWYWAIKKRKATLRLLAIMFGFLVLSLSGFFWYATQDNTIFIVAIGYTISQSVFILSLPKIAPVQFKILERNLGIKW